MLLRYHLLPHKRFARLSDKLVEHYNDIELRFNSNWSQLDDPCGGSRDTEYGVLPTQDDSKVAAH